MSGIRITLALVGTATLPIPLGTPPLWADAGTGFTVHPGTQVRAAHERISDPSPRGTARLDELAGRLDRLEVEIRALRAIGIDEVEPLERILVEHHSASSDLASRVALALVRESRRAGLDTRLLLAVMLVENPWLEPRARSFVGAVGLMQVMPFHAGGWGCGGADLTDPEVNICHGARILAHALHRSGGDLDRALLLYNGCVRGTNTPNCHRYPEWVRGTLARLPGERPAGTRADAP